jgi:hypothetical protein
MAPPGTGGHRRREQLPPRRRGRGGVICFSLSVVAPRAAVGDGPERVAIREGLAFGKALHAHLRVHWSQNVVSQRKYGRA